MASEPKRRGRPPKSETDLRRNNITFRCADELWDQLRVAAQENNRSMNKEMEERLEQSFSYNGLNMTFLKYLFKMSDPIPAIFEFAVLWERSISTANKRIRSNEHWYNSKEKLAIMKDYFSSNFDRLVHGIAVREQIETTFVASDEEDVDPKN